MDQKYKYNQNFFDSNKEHSLYWAGFIAADGNISNKMDFVLSLKLADKDHLEKFKESTGSDALIKILPPKEKIINNVKTKTSGTAIIRFRAKHWKNGLLKYNIVPNKTKKYTLPDWLISHNMFKAFIMGYFDGDGWFSLRTLNGKQRLGWGLCGNLQVLNKIRDHLVYTCKTNSIPSVYKQKNIWKFEFQNQHDVLKIVEYLYENSSIFLDRKYQISKLAQKCDDDTIVLNFQEEILFEAYNRLKSYKLVAKEFNCAKSTIAKYIKKFGTKMTKLHGRGR